ncbi:MAG: NAD(P)/FAD-dependent oxidoreductase [Rhodothermales bacterium]|nr:NAD(P)/FAD-dependent oxidoreductase [Rhodothermales bacterium]
MSDHPTVVIGAGPAGLTSAYELLKLGENALILEADDLVGGISRTVDYKGYKFDIGGHRFFSKVEYVNEIWKELLGDDLLERPRLSRIYYGGNFFDYPLRALNALSHLGPTESVRVGLSYLHARLFPSNTETTLEEWVSNRFGRRLFEIFFKTYTEKVWGIPCNEISSDWAAQRIKNLSLREAVRSALLGNGKQRDGEIITTLIDRFLYPRRGPGMMWERCVEVLAAEGTTTVMGERVEQIRHSNNRVEEVVSSGVSGSLTEYQAEHFISSMPLRELIHALNPPPPEEVLAAARGLRYRDYLTVVLIIDRAEVFPDNWIYIHDPSVQMGRIQNYKNWSEEMVPDTSRTSLGLEYFLWQKDDQWSWSDERLIELGIEEVSRIGLVQPEEVLDGTVVRMKKAYPVYDQQYHSSVDVLREYLNQFENLQTIGRNGLHRYNNQDHSMMTGVLAARNIVGDKLHNVWTVNTEKTYHEEHREEKSYVGDRLTPTPVAKPAASVAESSEAVLASLYTRLDPWALGAAMAVVCGFVVFFVTAVLLFRGGEIVGPNLVLLSQYLWGYSVTWPGAFIGLVEGAIGGFIIGSGIATLRNASLHAYLMTIRRRAGLQENPDLLGKI